MEFFMSHFSETLSDFRHRLWKLVLKMLGLIFKEILGHELMFIRVILLFKSMGILSAFLKQELQVITIVK